MLWPAQEDLIPVLSGSAKFADLSDAAGAQRRIRDAV